MNMVVKKAWGDLKVNLGRTMLVIFALSIGLWGVGSIIVSNSILTHDLRKNFLDTVPPQAILSSKDFYKVDINEIRKMPNIECAEYRDLSLLRIEVNPDEWIPLWLFGVENFNQFNMAKVYPQKGLQTPSPGTLLIERDGLLISHLIIGSRARIRAGKNKFKVLISGINFDPAQAPATQDHFIYAYTDKKTYSAISGKSHDQRLIVRFKEVRSKKEVEYATDKLILGLKSKKISVNSINIPKFNEHPHQWQLNTLLFIVGVIGLLAFIMGAVLVSQLMSAILASQVRQIGILKAIGGSKRKIFHIYLFMLLVFGVVSGMIAIPLALSTGYAFSRFVAQIINFDILTTTLPLRIYVYLTAASIFLPILLSLPIILKGLNGSVLEALNDYGVGRSSLKKKTDTVSKTRSTGIFTLALRNTMRKKTRLAITVISMALGVAIFSTGFNVRQSIYDLLSNFRDGLRYDVQVVINEGIDREAFLLPFKNIDNIKTIEAWNGGRGELQSQISKTTDGIGIISLPAETKLLKLNIIEGRMLRKSPETEILINQQARELMHNPKVGDTLVLNLKDKAIKTKLVGITEEFEKSKIYIDEAQYDALVNPKHLVNSLMFVAKDDRYDKVIELKKSIERAVEASDLNVIYVMSQAERVKVIYDHLQIVLATILFLAMLVLIVSALGMTSATSINIMERTREIGIMRAIGATPKMIYRIFILEGMILSTVSVFLGIVLAWPLSIVASYFFGNLMLGDQAVLRYAFSLEGFWVTLIATTIFGYFASLIPARKAIMVSTRTALSYE